MLNKALLKIYTVDEYDIAVRNKPFTFDKNAAKKDQLISVDPQKMMMKQGKLLILYTAIYIIYSASFMGFYIRERASKAKLLQMISGIHKCIFWLVPFLVDFIVFVIFIILVMLFTMIFDSETLSKFSNFMTILGIKIMFVFAVLPLTYIFTNIFRKPAVGATFLLILGFLTGMLNKFSCP